MRISDEPSGIGTRRQRDQHLTRLAISLTLSRRLWQLILYPRYIRGIARPVGVDVASISASPGLLVWMWPPSRHRQACWCGCGLHLGIARPVGVDVASISASPGLLVWMWPPSRQWPIRRLVPGRPAALRRSVYGGKYREKREAVWLA